MSRVRIVLFAGRDGSVPLLDWLADLPPKARAKCRLLLGQLAERGHELRRPAADYLRNGIYELRTKHQRVNYRMLYFFHQRWTVVLSHGFSKQAGPVPERDIELALRRKSAFENAPEAHTLEEDIEGP